jgi:ubiquinone biosynthesis protein COQ9
MSTAPRLSRSVLSTLRSQTRRPLRNAQKSSRYHSYDHPSPPPFPPAESAILSAALAHVPEHGFTTAALKLGARDAGYLDVSTNLLPRGVFELVNYHLVTQRLALRERVQFPTADGDPNQSNNNSRQRNNGVGTGGKVRTLTLARLRANEPILHRWQEVRTRPIYWDACMTWTRGLIRRMHLCSFAN